MRARARVCMCVCKYTRLCSANKRLIPDDVVRNTARYPFICPFRPEGRAKFVQRRSLDNALFAPVYLLRLLFDQR